MIERVARAMWEAREKTLPERTRVPFDERLTGDIWVMARAAIEAMREPTFDPDQVSYHRGMTRADWWRAMIDAALTTGQTAGKSDG